MAKTINPEQNCGLALSNNSSFPFFAICKRMKSSVAFKLASANSDKIRVILEGCNQPPRSANPHSRAICFLWPRNMAIKSASVLTSIPLTLALDKVASTVASKFWFRQFSRWTGLEKAQSRKYGERSNTAARNSLMGSLPEMRSAVAVKSASFKHCKNSEINSDARGGSSGRIFFGGEAIISGCVPVTIDFP